MRVGKEGPGRVGEFRVGVGRAGGSTYAGGKIYDMAKNVKNFPRPLLGVVFIFPYLDTYP